MDGPQSAGPVLAIDHDGLFKELLTTFFVEFLELFFPLLAASLDRDSIQFLPQELLVDKLEGREFRADIIVKARFKDERDGAAAAYFLIHVEHQSTAPATFAKRFLRYHLAIYWKYGLPVFPIVIYSHKAPKKKQPNVYLVKFADGEVLRFTYRVVQLNRLPWRRFLASHNPVASALMARMKVAERDRPKVKLECLRLMLTLQLNPARMRLIGTFVDSYLNLNQAEELRFHSLADESKLSPEEKEAVMEYVTSWERRGIEKGLERGLEKGLVQGREEGREQGRKEGAAEALRAVLVDILSARFGKLNKSIGKRIEQVDSIDELRALTHRALTVSSPGELGL